MQKTAKKFLSMLLALMMVLSILPTAVFATEQATVAAPLDSIVPYGANDQTTGTATISVQNPVTFTGYSAFENVPYYLVTVPAGTTYVKATYKDAAILTNATSGEASGYYADVPQWTGGGVEMAYTESNGDITITIPLNMHAGRSYKKADQEQWGYHNHNSLELLPYRRGWDHGPKELCAGCRW